MNRRLVSRSVRTVEAIRAVRSAAVFVVLLLPVIGWARQGGAVTLRMRFKAGETTRYQMNMHMAVSVAMAASAPPNHTVVDLSAVQTQKVLKALAGGGGVISTSTSDAHMSLNGQPFGSGAQMPVITARYDARGRQLSVSGLPKGGVAAGMMQGPMSSNGISSLTTVLPARPVRVGSEWTQTVPVPMGGATTVSATAHSTLIKLEDVGRFHTARIRTRITLPMNVNLNGQGRPTSGSQSMMSMSGSGSFTVETNFAIAEGKMVRTTGTGSMTMRMHMGRSQGAAPPTPGPIQTQMTLTMAMIQ